ncbi:membrane-bound lytic murein transglycosylase F [Thalassotalea insulae]|uniref:Membrane-bound lytic murein transglycosylase F n=1 Tax=Thalassotalea insulae TaxID=2056778 RepID=A0ABQ6GSC8_9GAMM|nr:membrane-bound lytic murein transglycosylase MltF [Thalassotalea insulae]GLX77046.1 membrane-bound lytic murein transglycosylase F [Thalassotalea insulae]
MKHVLFNILKNNVFLVIAIFLSVMLQACQTEQQGASLAKIKSRGYVNVGTLYGPTSYYVGAQGDTGFEYELAKKYADHLGVKLKISASYSLNDLFEQLESGEVDFLAAGLVVTDKRLAKYKFAPSYNDISQKLVFKQGKVRPRKISDLDGKLMVTANSSHVENLERLAASDANLSWQENDELDSEELLLQILEEEIDYTIVDSNTLAVSRRYYPEISIGFTIKEAEPMAWLVADNGDDSILASLIEFFGQVHHNGTLLALDDKYYGHVEQFNYVDTRLFIKAVEDKLPRYRNLFEKYGQEIDWKLLAAISYQESHWNPRARSHTGVRGMMMLTLPTARQMGIKSRIDAEQSIRGGAKYFKQMIDRMPARVPYPDRLWFALASYNVGLGHLNDARKITRQQGGDPDRWVEVKERLPLLKQKKYYKKTKYGYARGDEPVNYVENIRRYYDTLNWMDNKQQELEQQKLEQLELERQQQQEQQPLPPIIIEPEQEVGEAQELVIGS